MKSEVVNFILRSLLKFLIFLNRHILFCNFKNEVILVSWGFVFVKLKEQKRMKILGKDKGEECRRTW